MPRTMPMNQAAGGEPVNSANNMRLLRIDSIFENQCIIHAHFPFLPSSWISHNKQNAGRGCWLGFLITILGFVRARQWRTAARVPFLAQLPIIRTKCRSAADLSQRQLATPLRHALFQHCGAPYGRQSDTNIDKVISRLPVLPLGQINTMRG